MEEINVEAIIQSVRTEIEEAGYTESDLGWDETQGDDTILISDLAFDEAILQKQMNYLATHCDISWNRPLRGGVKGAIQRVVRKCIKFMIVPMNEEQCIFNHNVELCLEQLIAADLDRKEELRDLNKRLDELLQEIDECLSAQRG